MSASLVKASLSRLPFRAAAFVTLVCIAILSMSGWREWTAREASLKSAEIDLTNLARSLTQHAEDSFDLLDASILGGVGRLEADGNIFCYLDRLPTGGFTGRVHMVKRGQEPAPPEPERPGVADSDDDHAEV